MSDHDHDHEHEHGHTHESAPRDEAAYRCTVSSRPSALLVELSEHFPFSVSAVTIGLIVAGVICLVGFGQAGGGPVEHAGHEGHDHAAGPGILFFHLFHPAHMLFSAVATTAMFMRYERGVLKAIVVGLIGAIGVCGVSDIVIPQVSLAVLGVSAPWHICVYEHPMLVLPSASVGVLVGIAAAGSVARGTIISHSLHVFMSTMASIFYMIGPMGMVEWIDRIGQIFIFVLLAVMVPCCVSDIVFPLLMCKTGRERYVQVPHRH